MGVTVHAFAFDPARWASLSDEPPTIERLLEVGALTDELVVEPAHSAWLRAVPSRLGDNKKWYLNLSAESVYDAARERLADPVVRRGLDDLMSLLFWDPPTPAPDERRPVAIGATTYVYPPALVDRVLAGAEVDAAALSDAIRAAASAPDRPSIDHIHLWEPAWFFDWVEVWLGVFRAVRAAGRGWALVMWIWV